MLSRLILILLFSLVQVSAVYAQGGIGAVTDSFRKDFRNTPFPRDNNTQIIDEKDIAKGIKGDTAAFKVYVKGFEFTGNRVIDKSVLQEAVARYAGRLLTIAELNDAADAATDIYRKDGYMLSYAYIPEQIVTDDIVKIAVIEAQIGDINVKGASDYKSEFIKRHLTPLAKGVTLDSAVLERRLLLLNSYMDLNVRASLKSGTTPGSSDIIISVIDRNPYRLLFAVDNYGSKETNEYRLSGSAQIGNLIKSGDRVSLYLSMGLDNFNPEELFFGRFDYRIPILYDGWKIGATYSRSNYHATGDFEILNMRGVSNEYQLYAEYPAILKSKFSLNIEGRLSRKDTMDKLLGERNSADGVYTFAVTAYGDIFAWNSGGIYYMLTYTQGLNPLFGGSDKSNGSSNPSAAGYFEKLYADVNIYHYFTSYLRFNLLFSAQAASGPLLSPERFYIGGIYSVRGFEPGVNSGDNGYVVSLEAQTDVFTPIVKALIFYDRGFVQNGSSDNIYSSASLDSIGAGLRIYPIKGLALKVDYGYPINATNAEKGSGIFYARISYDI